MLWHRLSSFYHYVSHTDIAAEKENIRRIEEDREMILQNSKLDEDQSDDEDSADQSEDDFVASDDIFNSFDVQNIADTKHLPRLSMIWHNNWVYDII